MAKEYEDDYSVLESIKLAHKTPIILTKDEAIAFLKKPINLGRPIFKAKPRRGPQSKITQYDKAYKRRANPYRKLVKLPKYRLGKRTIDHEEIISLYVDYGKSRTTSKRIQEYLELKGKVVPDIRTIRRIIKSHEIKTM